MADRQFVVEAIFRALDQVSRPVAAMQGRVESFAQSLNSKSFSQSTKAFDDLAQRATRLGQALAQGNIRGAVSEFGGLVSAADKAGKATAGAGAAAEGATGAFAGLSSGALLAGAGLLAVAITAAATAAVLLKAADGAARQADAMGDLAEKTGIAVEDLSNLAFAAQQSDVDINSLATGIKFLQRNMVEVKTGAGDAYGALLQLGFGADEVRAGFGSTEDALLQIAQRFAQIEDPALKTSIAMRIFGRSGADLVPLLNRGAAGIKDLIKENERLGGVVTANQAKIGDDYTHAIEKLNVAQDGLKRQLAEAVIPTLTDFIQSITDVVAALNTLRSVKAVNFSDLLPPGPAKDAAEAVDRIRHALELYNKVANIAAGAPALEVKPKFAPGPIQPPALPRGALPAGQEFGQPVNSEGNPLTRNDIAPLEQAAIIEAAEKRQAELDKERAKAIEAAKAYAELRKSLTAFLALPSTSLPPSIAETLLKVDPKTADRFARDFEKVLDEAAAQAQKFRGLPLDEKGNQVPVRAQIQQSTNNELIAGLQGPRKEIEIAGIDKAIADGSLLAQVFESIGINVDALNERLAITGESVNSLTVLGEAIDASLSTSLSAAFDPLINGVDGTVRAVGNAKQTFDQAFDNLGAAITNGNTGFLRMTNIMEGLAKATHRFVIELGLAIAKALILKAITGFFSGGGKIVDVGTGAAYKAQGGPITESSVRRAPGYAAGGAVREIQPLFLSVGGSVPLRVPGYAEGGPIRPIHLPGFATGGAVLAGLTRPVHAAYGLALPGGPSMTDTIPAVLAAGEFVTANSGPKTGTQIMSGLVGGLDVIREVVDKLTSQPIAVAPAGPAIGAVHIHANDADSVRNTVRPGGSFEKQLARAAELGRSPWQ